MSFAQAQIARGLKKQMRGDLAGAMKHYRAVAQRDPKNPHALYFSALGAYYLKEMPRAIRLMTAVVKLAPKHADAWYNLGKFYHDLRDPETALVHYIAALEKDPDHVEALLNAGNVWAELGDARTAEQCYHRALAQDTNRPEAKYNRAFLRLARGEYLKGWQDYEARWECTGIQLEYGRDFMRTVPMWDGSEISGQTLLLHAEQGLGDTIQFIRYLPMVIERSQANVIVEVQSSLARLIRESFPDAPVYVREEAKPAFDVQCPLMSLPALCGTTLETIPWDGPYLGRLPWVAGLSFKTGICWAGSKGHLNDHNRSLSRDELDGLIGAIHGHKLTRNQNIKLVSLQIGERADECGDYMRRIDVDDFSDTAHIIAGLDLVITVDTAVAHLAGALGVPTWLMLPKLPDFRWLQDRTDSPWYPSMTLIRQTRRGDWSDVIERVRKMLESLVSTAGT
jgi:Tfp pilus assembly protein PilF